MLTPTLSPAPSILRLSENLLRTVEGQVTDVGAVRDETVPDREVTAQRVDLIVRSIEVVTDTIDVQQPAQGGVHVTVR